MQTMNRLPDNLDEHILHHAVPTSFIDTPAFVVLVLACASVLGVVIGVLLAL